MTDIDRIYQLFTEANPAPAEAAPTTERPGAAVILNERRDPTMLTKEPRAIEAKPAPVRVRRWTGPAIALATFVAVAAVGAAALLLLADGNSDVADDGTLPPVTTTLPPITTTLPDVVVPSIVSVPDLSGLTLAQARAIVGDVGLEVVALPAGNDADNRHGSGACRRESRSTRAPLSPSMCRPSRPATRPIRVAPGAGQVIISVFFECGNDDIYPTAGVGVPRIVPEEGEAVDRIEWTMRSLLAGLTPDERTVGFVSGFDDRHRRRPEQRDVDRRTIGGRLQRGHHRQQHEHLHRA